VTAGLVIASALLIAAALAPVVDRTADWPDVAATVGWLAAVVVARVGVTAAQERYAHRAAARTVAELRGQVLEHAARLGPRWLAASGGEAATLLTRGLDALEPYFVRYLPQLLLAVTVTPGALAVVLGLDWVAAVTIAVTLPLVPVFMWLIGQVTAGYADRRLAAMTRLGHQVLDLLAGIPTLQALGRHRGPATRVRELGEAHRQATMGTLRVAFLSGMVLELLTTLSVALVAVGVGLRLVQGELDLETGLAVLVLAPEVYLPLRQVGAQFHASSDGVAAAERAFAILEQPLPASGTRPAPDLRRATVRWSGVTVAAPDRRRLAPADLDATVRPGRVLALAGPNGAGKSTAVLTLLGLVSPDRGQVLVDEVDLAELDLVSWWAQISWVPQRPVQEPGTVRDAVDPSAGASAERLEAAARLTGLDAVLADLPRGWGTPLGQSGTGLSLGQRQRVALTRALLDPTPLVVLDEPTAHLDTAAEAQVVVTVRALRDEGRAVVLVAHRPTLLEAADDVVHVASVPLDDTPSEPTTRDAAAVGAVEVTP